MLHRKVLIWGWCIILYMAKGIEGFIGVTWGRNATHNILASQVVDMLLQNEVKHLAVQSISPFVVEPFANSNITLSITIREDVMRSASKVADVKEWIDNNVTTYVHHNVTLRYIIIGKNPFDASEIYQLPRTIDILKTISPGLQAVGHGKIKATLAVFPDDVLKAVTKPSDGEFSDHVKDNMTRTIRILQQHNAPLLLNIYPIYTVKQMNWDPEFAFLDNKSNFTIIDNGVVYKNVFEFIYDTFVWALRKAGAPNLKLVVGRIGWPTEGYPGANVENAVRFYKSFLPYIYKGKGTPLWPGPIDVYLHSLVDENRAIKTRGSYERHWGIYAFDGISKFSVDLTGQGREIKLANATGVRRMPKRWCIYEATNNDTTDYDNPATANDWFNYLCARADCSSLDNGGSCSNLNDTWKLSYAFNAFFQEGSQRFKECDMNGFGQISTSDPSVGDCHFPVEIMSADLFDGSSQFRNSNLRQEDGL